MGWPKGSGRDRGMPEDQWQEQQKRNKQASAEGRAVYVRGIPPDWTVEQLQDFFSFQGKVDGVNLLPPRPKQPALAAFVNFATYEEATSAAEVCDNCEVDDEVGTKFRLSCSMKQGMGKKVDYVSGFSELSKARQEGRSLYISGLPPFYAEEQVRDLVEIHGGLVEEVKILPKSDKTAISCFVILASPGEAATAIEGLDNQEIEGHVISCGYPKSPKRTRDAMEEEALQERQAALPALPPPKAAPRPPGVALVEIRGFPFETTPELISSAIEAGGRTVQSVRIEPDVPGSKHGSVARVQMKSAGDSRAVVAELHNFEFMPGCFLQVAMGPELGGATAKAPQPPRLPPPPALRAMGLTRTVPPPPPQPPAKRPCGGIGGPRRRGRVVGRLGYDRSAYRGGAAQNGVAGQPTTPSEAPHLEEGEEQELDQEL